MPACSHAAPTITQRHVWHEDITHASQDPTAATATTFVLTVSVPRDLAVFWRHITKPPGHHQCERLKCITVEISDKERNQLMGRNGRRNRAASMSACAPSSPIYTPIRLHDRPIWHIQLEYTKAQTPADSSCYSEFLTGMHIDCQGPDTISGHKEAEKG
jgi:hypothetical protein